MGFYIRSLKILKGKEDYEYSGIVVDSFYINIGKNIIQLDNMKNTLNDLHYLEIEDGDEIIFYKNTIPDELLPFFVKALKLKATIT